LKQLSKTGSAIWSK